LTKKNSILNPSLTAGETALHLAALNGNFLSARILLDAGSDIQVPSPRNLF